MTMMLALTADEEVKCSGESADVSTLSASGVGWWGQKLGGVQGTKGGRK